MTRIKSYEIFYNLTKIAMISHAILRLKLNEKHACRARLSFVTLFVTICVKSIEVDCHQSFEFMIPCK